MKVYKTSEIRNVALLGNAGAGKTIMAESMLFNSGQLKRRGDISSKNTVSDYREIEHEQEGSVSSSILFVEWKDKKINLLDTPGADDFIGGVASSLHVSDSAVLVLNAQNGVEVGTEIQWRQTKSRNIPVVFAINHLDHEKTNFEKTIEEAKQFFGSKVILAQYPVNAGVGFDAVIDLITMKMYKWNDENGNPEELDIPEGEKDRAAELQNELIEAAAESEEELMETFFENETLTKEQMLKGIQLGVKSRNLFPVFCTSAKKNMGINRMLDFIAEALPSPDQMPAPKDTKEKEIKCDPQAPASLFVFKNSIETHLGEVLFFKVLSGTIQESMDLINTNRQSKERLSQLYITSGKNREKVPQVVAGDIAATVKLKETKTNHTLSDKDADIQFPEIVFPEPKYRTAIVPQNDGDDEKMGEALGKIREEDPTYILEYSKELKQLIIHGQGEFHLNTLKWMLDNIYKIPTEFIAPKIPYRETITKVAQASYRHKKQSGGAGQFGEVHLVIEPYVEGAEPPSTFKAEGKEISVNVRDTQELEMNWGGKLIYYNCIVGGVIDARFMPAILKGIMEKMEVGPLTGCYARDIRVSVYDGKMHPVDSNEVSFKIAGSKAFADAFKKAGPKIMEPVYDVEVMVPSDRMGDVMSDLQGRRAIIQGMKSERGYEFISAKVPLAEMNKYSTALSSLTNGRATYTMRFDQYTEVPHDIQEKLLKAYAESQDEE